jgi:hypothetical protein
MVQFTKDISNFQKFGTYNYRLDEVGNEILNPSSSVFQENYFAFSLTNLNYDQSKILSFYNPEFTEFVKPKVTESISRGDDVELEIQNLKTENSVLLAQLNELIAQSEMTSNVATEQLIKNIILNLRVNLGQGKIEADFNTEFPYLPLPSEEQPSNQV